MEARKLRRSWVLASLLVLVGCAGTRSAVFLHPEFNFGYVERVAVVPFENLSDDQGAGARITRLFVSNLFATKAFDVVEPGEVSEALQRFGTLRTAELTTDQIKELGATLKVQALILGSVGETASGRGSAGNVCTLVVRMVEVDAGTTIWSATTTATGRGFWSTLLGTGRASESEVARDCVDRAIRTLVR